MEGLLALGLILILYIYGEQDRFLVNDNPREDFADFGFILLMILVFWTVTKLVFTIFKTSLGQLKKPVFLTLRGMTLLTLIIPLDILFNHLYLNIAYGLPLYEDYWVLEIPLKASLILLINFLDQVVLPMKQSDRQLTSLRIKTGNQYRFITFNCIAYFLVQNQLSYLYTHQGEKIMVDEPLSKFEKDLNNKDFFRASRQLLVSRQAISGYRSAHGKKIELQLTNNAESANFLISRLNAPDFRKWINAEPGTLQA